MYKEPEWEVEDNEWHDGGEIEISIVGAYIEGGRVVLTTVNENPPSDDDNQDENFVWDGEETEDGNDVEDVSLDEEINSSDSGNDEQLEAQIE